MDWIWLYLSNDQLKKYPVGIPANRSDKKVLILYDRSVSTPLRKVQLDGYFCEGQMELSSNPDLLSFYKRVISKAIFKNVERLVLFP